MAETAGAKVLEAVSKESAEDAKKKLRGRQEEAHRGRRDHRAGLSPQRPKAATWRLTKDEG